jgi:hypothetical protein
MVLNLIMTMLDKLGPTILQNPTQIVAFASNVIDSHLMQADHQRFNEPTHTLETQSNTSLAGIVNLDSQEDNADQTLEDDEAAIMEDELSTLFLAVNLLGAVLNGMYYMEYVGWVSAWNFSGFGYTTTPIPPKEC